VNLKNKFQLVSLIILSSVLFSACTNKNTETNLDLNMNQNTNQNTVTSSSEDNNSAPQNPVITETPTQSTDSAKINTNDTLISIKTKDGEIIAKLYSKETPNTVANFIQKADSGFYKNLTFHRVITGFMAQGGDPTGTGMGGGKQASELNSIPFVRGSFGLARTAETNQVSNDSQFFICFTTEGCQHLTGDYVNFGEVVSGLDILDKIQQGDKIIEITTKTK
jgi:cyclophilin family peptidyl-prolyl cis-trans isomerase